VLIDFSVGDYAAAESITSEALPPGTPRYRSPEAALFWEQHRHTPGARYAFKETDEIYALGAVLYDVLTHIRPSEAHKSEPTNNPFIMPASPFEVTQGRVPQALSDLTMNLIAREPGERPAHARDVRRVLADLKEHAGPAWQAPFHAAAAQVPPAPSSAARVRALLSRVAPKLGEHGWRPWLALGGGLVLASFLGILSAAPRPPEAAKQTTPSVGLPSSTPTQKETSPAVKPPENASPPAVSQAPQTHKAGAQRALSLAEKCTLAIAMTSWLKLGCAGVQPRPEPGYCPRESVAGMEKILGWAPSEQSSIFIVMDVNQPPPENYLDPGPAGYGVYKDGPITGELAETMKRAPKGTKLTGHLWTSGERIFGRYLWAHVPGKGKIPICLELGDTGELGLDKEEGSKPGAVIARRRVNAYPTRDWR
jgi:hypothetical protein